jgi:hypothetical protein
MVILSNELVTLDSMNRGINRVVPYQATNDPVLKPIPPYQPANAFIPSDTADLNTALGLFPPNPVNIQTQYYALSDIQKIDPNIARQEQIGSFVETGISVADSDPGIFGRITKTTIALAVVGGSSILMMALGII